MLSIAQYEDVDFASCGRDDESVGGLGAQAKPAANPLPGPDRALRTGGEAVIASKHDIVTSRRHVATCVQSSVSKARAIRPADNALFFTRTNFIGVATERGVATAAHSGGSEDGGRDNG